MGVPSGRGNAERLRWKKAKWVSQIFNSFESSDHDAEAPTLDSLSLQAGMQLRFNYDMGSPTNLVLKVMRAQARALAQENLPALHQRQTTGATVVNQELPFYTVTFSTPVAQALQRARAAALMPSSAHSS